MKKIILTLSFSLLLLLGTAVPKSDQEDSKAALAAELLTKLKSSQVKVIAAGHVSGQLALFISGSGSKTDFSGGYQVTVGSDPGDGRFDVDSVEKLAGKYSGFGKATDSMFLCSDSDSSSSLIAMNNDNVWAFNLAENKLTPLPIVPGAMSACYQSGEIFFASNKPKHYFQLKSSGNVTLSEFVSATIASAQICTPLTTLGHLCATGKSGDAKITIASSCSESPPSDITAGYIGDSKAYLFDKDNAVYYFDASIFQGGGQQSVKLTKVPSFQAWFTLASISTANPHELSTTAKGGIAITTIIIIVVVALLILCILAGVVYYFKYDKKEEDGDDKGKKKKDKKEKDSKSGSGSGANRKSGQKSSSSQGEGKKKKEKSKSGATPSAKTGTGRRRRGSRRSRPSKSTTVKSKPSGVESKVSNQGERSSSVEGGGGVPTKSPKAKTVAVAPKGKRFSGSNRGKVGGGGGGSSRGFKKLPGGKLKSKTGAKVPAVVSGTSPAPTAQAPAVPAAAPVSPPAPAEDPKKAVAPVDGTSSNKNVAAAAARPRASSSRNRNKSGQMKRKRSSKKRVSSGGRKKSKKRSSEKKKKKRSKSKGGRGHSRRGSKGSRGGGGSKSRGGHSKTRTPKGGGGAQQPKLPGPPGVQADLKMKSLENLGLAGGPGAPKTEQPPPSTSGLQGAPPPPMSDDVPSDELPPE